MTRNAITHSAQQRVLKINSEDAFNSIVSIHLHKCISINENIIEKLV